MVAKVFLIIVGLLLITCSCFTISAKEDEFMEKVNEQLDHEKEVDDEQGG